MFKKDLKEKKRIYIVYDETRDGGEYESDEPFSSRSPTFIDVSFRSLHKESPKDRFFYTSIEVDDDSLFNEKNYIYV